MSELESQNSDNTYKIHLKHQINYSTGQKELSAQTEKMQEFFAFSSKKGETGETEGQEKLETDRELLDRIRKKPELKNSKNQIELMDRSDSLLWKAQTLVFPSLETEEENESCRRAIKKFMQDAPSQPVENQDSKLELFNIAEMKEQGEQEKKDLHDKKCRDILRVGIENQWRLNNEKHKSDERNLPEARKFNTKNNIMRQLTSRMDKSQHQRNEEIIVPNMEDVRRKLKKTEETADCSRFTLLRTEDQYFVVHQALDEEIRLSLSVHMVDFSCNRFKVSSEKIELISKRSQFNCNLDKTCMMNPMLADFVFIGGQIYYFDFKEESKYIFNVRKLDSEIFEDQNIYTVQLKRFNVITKQVETQYIFEEIVLPYKLLGIQFVKSILTVDNIESSYVLLVMEQQAVFRSFKDFYEEVKQFNTLMELSVPLTFHHLEAFMIESNQHNQQIGQGQLYLSDMLGLVNIMIEDRKKYFFLFFSKNYDVALFENCQEHQHGEELFKRIDLTKEQKKKLCNYWESRTAEYCSLHRIQEGQNKEEVIVQDHPQTEHVKQLIQRIFQRRRLAVSALHETSNKRYLLLIGNQHTLSVENLHIFAYKTNDYGQGSQEVDNDIWVNKFLLPSYQATVLMSKKITNLLVYSELTIGVVEDRCIEFDEDDPMVGFNQFQPFNYANIEGLEDYDLTDPAIQMQMMTVIEDSDEIRLAIIGESRDGALCKNQSIIGLWCDPLSGKVIKVPGIDTPLSIFGSEEYYACLAQASDPQEVDETADDGSHISYMATRYSVSLMKRLHPIEVVVLELVVKMFELAPDSKQLSDSQVTEAFKATFHASIIGQKIILMNAYDQVKLPLLYPFFQKVNGSMRIIGVRLELTDEDESYKFILRNDYSSKNPIEGALTSQAISNMVFIQKKKQKKLSSTQLFSGEKNKELLQRLQTRRTYSPADQEKIIPRLDAEDFMTMVQVRAMKNIKRQTSLLGSFIQQPCGHRGGFVNRMSSNKRSGQHVDLQAIIAEVRLQPGVQALLGTQYDPFKRKGFNYLRVIFQMQIKNIMNSNRYSEDPLIHVDDEEFEKISVNEFFQNCDILNGLSPGEIALDQELSKERLDSFKKQFYQVPILQDVKRQNFQIIKSQQKKCCHSFIESAICMFKNQDFDNYIWEQDYVVREDDFLQYDRNCQSNLVAMFKICEQAMETSNYKNSCNRFRSLLELTFLSKMRPAIKREHLTGVLKLAGHDYQCKNPKGRNFMQIVWYMDEQAGDDETVFHSPEQKFTCFRQLIEKSPDMNSFDHLSKFYESDHDKIIESSDLYLASCLKKITNQLEENKNYGLKHKYHLCCRFNKDSRLSFSYLDYRPLILQKFIIDTLAIKDGQTAMDASSYRFNRLELCRTNRGILKQCIASPIDFMNFQAVCDSIEAIFKQESSFHFQKLSLVFYYGHVLPTFIHLVIPNDPHDDGFRSSKAAFLVYIASIVSLVTQVYLARLEFLSRLRSVQWSWINDTQNAVDIMSIIYSLFYNLVRIYFPASPYLSPGVSDKDEDGQRLQEAMPIVHFFAVVLTAGQAIFYLQLDKKRSKFLSLFWMSIIDISAFLIIFFLSIGVQTLLLHVLGASFDTGGNYDQDEVPYDTSHGDYYLVSYLGVIIIANLRNSMDDLQPPSYNYWVEQYDTQPSKSLIYIGLIWFVYFLGLVNTVILALNFLIAIVSQSYENIMDRQENTIVNARNQLNVEYAKQVNPDPDKDIELLVMATAIGRQDDDEEWQGLTRTIKKELKRSKLAILDQVMNIRQQVENKGSHIEMLQAQMRIMQNQVQSIKEEQHKVVNRQEHQTRMLEQLKDKICGNDSGMSI